MIHLSDAKNPLFLIIISIMNYENNGLANTFNIILQLNVYHKTSKSFCQCGNVPQNAKTYFHVAMINQFRKF